MAEINISEKQQNFTSHNEIFDDFIIQDAEVDKLFKKHFIISCNEVLTVLPEPQLMFKEQPWQQDNLQALKNDLNNVKNRLNNFNLHDWQWHTNQMYKAKDVHRHVKRDIQPEFITQAWCKFYEIACKYPLVPLEKIPCVNNHRSFTSIHLCEAPGAFVVALNHWLKTNAHDVQWDWMATTLNPYCEGNPCNKMVDDDRFIRHTLEHWHFGVDNTGDLMDLKNLDDLVTKSKDVEGQIMLVTADGSIDCTDMPGEQERTVAHLQLCETIACMHFLHKGGSFLLKVFTLFEHHSVCLMYLLSCAFHEVVVTKPATSKEGNSEIYIVCLNFKGKDYIAPYVSILRKHYDTFPMEAMFRKEDIPEDFMQKIINCNKQFKYYQCCVIEDNISTFQSDVYNDILSKLKYIKRAIAIKYFNDCNLSKIDSKDEIVGREIMERSYIYNMCTRRHNDSYNERCKKQNLRPQERLSEIWNQVKEIKPIKKFYTWHPQVLPEVLRIYTGKIFTKICNSRFCGVEFLRMLNEVNNILQVTHSTICFPSIEITEKIKQQHNSNCQTLNFQFLDVCNSHQTITKICDGLEKLQTSQTLVLIGYSLLTQLNVDLLYILGNSFHKVTMEIHSNESYHIKLEIYQHNEKVSNYLSEILKVSHEISKKNMSIWSVIPMTALYEWDQFPAIMQFNHLVIKLYARQVANTIGTRRLSNEETM